MRLDLFIYFLTLLVGIVVRQKESCTTSNQAAPSKLTNLEKSSNAVHLLVIGAGAQTVIFLARLIAKNLKLRMVIVEKNPEFGHGFPYDEKQLTPEHRLNIFALPGFSITSDPRDFQKWLYTSRNFMKLDILRPAEMQKSPPPRMLIGKYLTDRFHQYVAKCRRNGFEIDLVSNTSAENITRGESEYTVKLSNDDRVKTKNVFLATGYWDQKRFDHEVDGYFNSPWPASDLLGIPANQHVGIFGASLSAIDAALTLAHKFGKFKRVKGNLVYQLFDKGNSFNMTMYSRSGQFPTVGGVLENFGLNHMIFPLFTNSLTKYKNGKPYLPLDDVFGLLKNDFMRLMPDSSEFSNLNPKNFFKKLEDRFPGNAAERLRDGINKIRNKDKRSAQLQTFFAKAGDFFNKIAEFFFAEDTIRFKTEIASKMLKFGTAMPLVNAEKMLALMEAGRLNLEAVGSGCEFEAMRKNQQDDADSFAGIRLKCATSYEHRYFIDARGQSDDIESDSSKLTQSLLANKLIEPLCIPYFDPEKGKEAFEDKENEKSNKIQFINGEYCYKAGGIDLDKGSMRVIARSDIQRSSAGVIYASGPYAYGRFPFAQSLDEVETFAGLVVRDMGNRY